MKKLLIITTICLSFLSLVSSYGLGDSGCNGGGNTCAGACTNANNTEIMQVLEKAPRNDAISDVLEAVKKSPDSISSVELKLLLELAGVDANEIETILSDTRRI